MKRIVLLCLVVLLVSSVVYSALPEICRLQGGNVRTIWGVGFTPGQTEVWGWNAPYDPIGAKAAIAAANYNGRNLLPPQPPPGAAKVSILDNDPRGQVMAIDFNERYGGESYFDALLGRDAIWVKNEDGWARPWLVRSAEPWFVYPEIANPGQRIRVFGRNLATGMDTNLSYAVENKTKFLFAIKPKAGGAPIFLSHIWGGRMYQHGSTIYEASAVLPADLKPGAYQMYVHNGFGGVAGWGGPMDFTVKPEAKPVSNILDVKAFGAKGNGLADDTEAIRATIRKAAKSAPAIVYFPPGRYAISKTILLRSGVSLQGAGMNNSIIIVHPKRPLSYDIPAGATKMPIDWLDNRMTNGHMAPMLMMESNSELLDLGMVDGPGTEIAVYVGHDNCHIERCHISTLRVNDAFSDGVSSVLVEWGSYGFVMKDCAIESASGCLVLRHGPHIQAYVGGNRFQSLRQGLPTSNFGVRAVNRSIIENNFSSDAQRNFGGTTGRASMYHTIIQGNSWFNNVARRHNGGENMYESSTSMWHGKVLSATANTITVTGTPFAATQAQINTRPWNTAQGTFVLILDGRGLGQYREVASFTGNTLTLAQPWEITPDSSTYFCIGKSSVETLWIDNTEEHTANWTGLWGNCWGNVIDGHILRDGEGIYLWAFDSRNPSPVAFNDVIGSGLITRAQIRFIGPLVFGNTVRSTEITGFRYAPSLHGSMGWANNFDAKDRFAIDFADAKSNIPNLPATAPLKDWNIIENDNIYDGPKGIYIAPNANHNILKHVIIDVDGEKIVDKSATTVVRDK